MIKDEIKEQRRVEIGVEEWLEKMRLEAKGKWQSADDRHYRFEEAREVERDNFNALKHETKN